MSENLFRKGLYVGCTAHRHQQIGVHIAINARAGELWRNDDTLNETEMKRDAQAVKEWRRIRLRFFPRFYSKWFRKHMKHILEELQD